MTPPPGRPPLDRRDRLALALQRWVARILTPVSWYGTWVWLRFVRRYRIAGLPAFRAELRRRLGPARSPLLICANHLTLIDSCILLWALGSAGTYLRDERAFAWNLPERRNFGGTWALRFFCYVGKCIQILRQGPPEVTARTMAKVRHLLAGGHRVMVFPEGTRSRSGRVDTENFTYGVGRLVQEVPGTRVLCLYLRGRGQETWGDLPRKGETFDLLLDVLEPASSHTGMRGARDISRQIVYRLAEMEQAWLAAHR